MPIVAIAALHRCDRRLQQAIRLDRTMPFRLAAMYVLLPTYTNADVQPSQQMLELYAQKASALDPALAEPYASLGFSYGKFPGRLLDQRKAFGHALELNADDVTTNLWFGLSLVKTGYHQRGVALIDRALTLDPMLPNALRWRGILYFDGGDIERADQLLRRARDLGLQFADRNLADVANARGDAAAARNSRQRQPHGRRRRAAA